LKFRPAKEASSVPCGCDVQAWLWLELIRTFRPREHPVQEYLIWTGRHLRYLLLSALRGMLLSYPKESLCAMSPGEVHRPARPGQLPNAAHAHTHTTPSYRHRRLSPKRQDRET
jgi:hypothetical protein